jgi:ribose transport system ATP-binding protein
MRARALEALAHFDHPDIRPDAIAGKLSVSALQLVEIGRSLAMGCKLLVLDEPTSSLAQKDIERLFTLIDRLKAQGISIIYISHFLEEVKRLASRLTVLRDGSVVGTRDVATVTPEEVVSLMVGRDVEDTAEEAGLATAARHDTVDRVEHQPDEQQDHPRELE